MSLDVYVVTFNCGREFVEPVSFSTGLFQAWPKSAKALPDIIALSLQEVAPIADAFRSSACVEPYVERFTKAVDLAAGAYSHDGQSRPQFYKVVEWHHVGMTALLILAKPAILDRISHILTAGVGVGLYKMGNKGAVGVRFAVDADADDVSQRRELTFVAAHLYPYESGVQRRNQNWKDIVQNLVFESGGSTTIHAGQDEAEEPLIRPDSRASSTATGIFKANTILFVAGDLNYRTSDTVPAQDAHVNVFPLLNATADSDRHFSHLFKDDQLTREKAAGRTLHGLSEMAIDFPPTYKYVKRKDEEGKGSDDDDEESKWQWAEHRYPSWCDRILFAPASAMKGHIYTALPLQDSSDHRPVALSISITARDGSNEQRNTSASDSTDSSMKSPYPLNKNWRSERDVARMREVVVGNCAFLVMTKKGNALAAVMVGIGIAALLWIRALQ